MKLFTSSLIFLVASSYLACQAGADKPFRQRSNGRLVRVRALNRNGRTFGSRASTGYGAPSTSSYAVDAPQFLAQQPSQTTYTVEAAPAPVIVQQASTSYGAAAPPPPAPVAAPAPTPTQAPIVAARAPSAAYNSYVAAAPVVQDTRAVYTVPSTSASVRSEVRTAKPIAIVRSSSNAPGTPGFERSFDYSFEAENGINQEASGEVRTVGDAEVMVMRGSYQYTGADGEDYQVNWYADETGYHAEAEHLPKSVPIPFPEIQEAVDAQLRFAEEERAAGRGFDNGQYNQASSNIVEVKTEFDELAQYGK